MPLAFDSINRGTVPFGYFNIDTDLLLLDDRFFFTEAFTTAVSALAAAEPGEAADLSIAGYVLDDPRALGNVMGAIAGVDLSGFIGEVYRRFPFPPRREDFWQRAEGEDNRDVVEPMLSRWAQPVEIALRFAQEDSQVIVGPVSFREEWFRELVAYVWRGGYPRWLDGVRPACVQGMRESIERSPHPLFEEQSWDLTLRPC